MSDTANNTIAILPLGATEQHGPHLPFETDSRIAQGIVDRLKQAIPADISIDVLPVETIGYSLEHMDVVGSKTLAFDDAVHKWVALGGSLTKIGIRKLLFLNAHGGNSPLMTIAAQELRVRHNMLAVASSWTRFDPPAGLISEDERAFGIHGGDIETSVMLALDPGCVDMIKAADFPNLQRDMAERFTNLRAYGKHAFGWKAGDLNPQGVTGNAAAATAEKGEALLDNAVKGYVQLLREMSEMELPDA